MTMGHSFVAKFCRPTIEVIMCMVAEYWHLAIWCLLICSNENYLEHAIVNIASRLKTLDTLGLLL